jgi:hypothetical protein
VIFGAAFATLGASFLPYMVPYSITIAQAAGGTDTRGRPSAGAVTPRPPAGQERSLEIQAAGGRGEGDAARADV